jgi:hypothetical protein
MKTTGRLWPVIGLTALGLLLSGSAGAARGDLEETAGIERADLVFKGVVERVDYAFSDAQGGKLPHLPHTFVTYRIEEVLRGVAPGETITLRFVGGRGREASFMMVSDLPLFDVGDRDVLLVSDNTESGCPLVGCAQGRFRLLQGHVFNDEGQAIEVDANGRLAAGAYFDLPEVMTHHVSQTTITRRDHFEQGESREAYAPESAGAQLTEDALLARWRAISRSLPQATVQARNADIQVPFTLAAAVAEPAPAERARAGRAAPASAQERAELEALERSGGDPVIE